MIRKIGLLAVSGAVNMACLSAAHAVNFDIGDARAKLDTTVTYGIQARTSSADSENLGSSYGNRLFNDSGDIVSNRIRASHTLQIDRGQFGALVRGNYFYDRAFDTKDLPSEAEDRLVFDELLTDAFVYGSFGPWNNVSIRLGKQVISWGENTFIQGSLNDINTVDVTKLRQPGSALQDAFIGTPAAYAMWNFGTNWTAETFYLFDHDRIRIDPMGSPFATLDAVTDGGGFDDGGDGNRATPCVAPDGVSCALGPLRRTDSKRPSGADQYGFALRRFFPGFFSGGEVALYFQNLDDHVFMLSTRAATGQYMLDYPSDIKRFGISFNTNVAGLAVSGEVHQRMDAPIQLLAPLANEAAFVASGGTATPPQAAGSFVRGYEKIDRNQAQVTVQKNWGVVHAIGAAAGTTTLEVAYGWINGLPDSAKLFEPVTNDFSGFQVRQSFLYESALLNVIGVSPNMAFRWDTHGNSNELGGAKLFVEDRKSLSLGLGFDYGSGKYQAGLSWTNFFGSDSERNAFGGKLNGNTDRDFVEFNISMSL